MDNTVIQLVIRGILESGEYSLAGIAYATRIPFDVVLEASCGTTQQLSVTAWTRIVDLFMQVKPEIATLLLKKFLQMHTEDHLTIAKLLGEE